MREKQTRSCESFLKLVKTVSTIVDLIGLTLHKHSNGLEIVMVLVPSKGQGGKHCQGNKYFHYVGWETPLNLKGRAKEIE